MASAKVELLGCLSLAVNGRTFKKGQPVLLSSAEEIAQFKGNPMFRVELLPEPEQKAPVPKVEAPKAPDKPEVEPKAEAPKVQPKLKQEHAPAIPAGKPTQEAKGVAKPAAPTKPAAQAPKKAPPKKKGV